MKALKKDRISKRVRIKELLARPTAITYLLVSLSIGTIVYSASPNSLPEKLFVSAPANTLSNGLEIRAEYPDRKHIMETTSDPRQHLMKDSSTKSTNGSEPGEIPAKIPTYSARPELPPSKALVGSGNPMDLGYFSDAAFIGDSLTNGLSIFGWLRSADFFAYSSANVFSIETLPACTLEDGEKVPAIEALGRNSYRKVYIMLGINELGCDRDSVLSQYSRLLNLIKTLQPEALIYVQSLLPVTRSKAETDETFNFERIFDFNLMLLSMAEEHGVYYLDVFSALADEAGYLPEEASADGVHPSKHYYDMWCEYLNTHTVQEQE